MTRVQRIPRTGGLFLVLFTSLFFPGAAVAASGTEGAAFLDIPVGAGPAALGSAYSALATDAYAPVWNPAGLGFVPVPEVAAQHLSYLDSINYEFASVAFPVSESFGTLGASFQYLGSGNIAGTDRAGMPVGDFSVHYGAYSLAYGRQINEKLSFGVTGKVINAQIADVSANAYAADVGTLYKATDKLHLAATVTNAGSKLTFDDQSDSLPLAFHVAAAYQPERHVKVAVEGLKSKSGPTNGRVGVEWSPLASLAIRAGYKSDTTKQLSALAGFSTGVGITAWGQEFSYAWLPYGDLGDTQYFSLLLRFGQAEELEEKRNLIQYQTIKKNKTAGSLRTSDSDYQQLLQLLRERAEQAVSLVREVRPS